MITIAVCLATAVIAMFIFGFAIGYRVGEAAGVEKALRMVDDYYKSKNRRRA